MCLKLFRSKPITPPCSLSGKITPLSSSSTDASTLDGNIFSSLHQLLTRIPNTKSITFDGHFLIIHTIYPPSGPLPKTICGLPTYITNNPSDSGPISHLTRNPGRGTPIPYLDLDVRNQETLFEGHITELTSWLEQHNIKATEIQYWKFFIVVVLKDRSQDLTKVPCSFAQLPCYYLFERDMQIPVINSVSNTENNACGGNERHPSAKTWISVNGTAGRKWVQARWVWKGWRRQDTADIVPMAGWNLCVSREGLSELLGGEG